MTHKSTAVSFILSLRKPVIFLTTNDLERLGMVIKFPINQNFWEVIC